MVNVAYFVFNVNQHFKTLRGLRGLIEIAYQATLFTSCLLACILPFSVSAATSEWVSSDDPTWYYTATLSNPMLRKVAATQEGLPFIEGAVPVSVSHCTMGESGLFDKNLFVWCYFSAGHSKIGHTTEKPYSHWFYLEQPSPFDPYWMGSRLLVWGNALHFGPGFVPMDLPNTTAREGDRITSYRVWNNATSWSGATSNMTGNIIYLSREAIEADMFGKKHRSQNTLRQPIHMTDPVNFSDACCDNGVYEQSFSYDITLQRAPLLVTLPTHVDMGEVPIGADSDPYVIPVSVSAKVLKEDIPVEIEPGIANITFTQLKALAPDSGRGTCDATILVSNEQGQVNAGDVVDLYSFRNGIATKVINTDGCTTGSHNGSLSFTVSWQ